MSRRQFVLAGAAATAGAAVLRRHTEHRRGNPEGCATEPAGLHGAGKGVLASIRACCEARCGRHGDSVGLRPLRRRRLRHAVGRTIQPLRSVPPADARMRDSSLMRGTGRAVRELLSDGAVEVALAAGRRAPAGTHGRVSLRGAQRGRLSRRPSSRNGSCGSLSCSWPPISRVFRRRFVYVQNGGRRMESPGSWRPHSRAGDWQMFPRDDASGQA